MDIAVILLQFHILINHSVITFCSLNFAARFWRLRYVCVAFVKLHADNLQQMRLAPACITIFRMKEGRWLSDNQSGETHAPRHARETHKNRDV